MNDDIARFGPSGNDEAFYEKGFKHSIDAPKYIADMGLSAYEYNFTKGVNLSEKLAIEIGQEAKKYNIEITAHAPYYINLANPSDEMAEKSFGYIISSLKMLKLMGGTRLVVHTATQGKATRDEALALVRTRLARLDEIIHEEGLDDMWICLETMGKYSQIGSYTEIIDLCTISDRFMPTFDFGHINCVMQGGLKTPADYKVIYDYCLSKLGKWRANHPHVHFSHIEYNAKGEVKHLTNEDTTYGPNFEPYATFLVENDIYPVIISESRGTQSMDAKQMQDIYLSKLGKK